MGYLNSNIYQNGIDHTLLDSNKKYVIALTTSDIRGDTVDASNIAAVSAIINGGGNGSPSLDAASGHLNNVFAYSNKTLTINSISYNYTKDVLSNGAGDSQGGKYNNDSSLIAQYFAVIDLGNVAAADEVEITPFTGATDNIKIPTVTKIASGTPVITGQLSGSGVTIQANNNFLFGAVTISFSETDSAS